MKSFSKQLVLVSALTLSLGIFPFGSSDAVTSTATLSVGATVVSNCKVSASALTFPNYVSGQSDTSDATTTLSYTGCPNQSLRFELNDGSNVQGSYRGMRSSSGTILGYQLYRNTNYNTLLGTGSNGVSFTAPSSGTGSVNVYGRIPANQAVPAGNYSDSVGVTLTF